MWYVCKEVQDTLAQERRKGDRRLSQWGCHPLSVPTGAASSFGLRVVGHIHRPLHNNRSFRVVTRRIVVASPMACFHNGLRYAGTWRPRVAGGARGAVLTDTFRSGCGAFAPCSAWCRCICQFVRFGSPSSVANLLQKCLRCLYTSLSTSSSLRSMKLVFQAARKSRRHGSVIETTLQYISSCAIASGRAYVKETFSCFRRRKATSRTTTTGATKSRRTKAVMMSDFDLDVVCRSHTM